MSQVTFKGTPLELEGVFPAVGGHAPDAVVINGSLDEVKLSSYNGKVRIVISVPSLDTPVCDVETRRFNSEVAGLGVDLLAVSMDLPFAQGRWCVSAAAENVTALSDHRGAEFGRAYGVLVKPLRLLARAVLVIGADDKVHYGELVPEIADQPDYDAAVEVVKRLIKG